MASRKTYELLNIRSEKTRKFYRISSRVISFVCIFMALESSFNNGIRPVYLLWLVPPVLYTLAWYFAVNLRGKK